VISNSGLLRLSFLLGPYLSGGVLGRLGLHVSAHDLCSEGREPVRARLPDAAARPDHERGLAGEVEHRAVVNHVALLD